MGMHCLRKKKGNDCTRIRIPFTRLPDAILFKVLFSDPSGGGLNLS